MTEGGKSIWPVVMGVLMILLGMAAIGSPFVAGTAWTILLGGIVLVGGIAELAHAFFAANWKAGILKFIGGVLALILGVLILTRPVAGLAFITLMLAIYFVIDGIFKIVLSLKLRPLPGWGWMLFSGIITLILGGLIWGEWPLSGVWAVGVLLGLRILFAGWAMIFVGMGASQPAVPAAE